MVPVQIQVHESLPLNANGKVDRNALSQRGWQSEKSQQPTQSARVEESDHSATELIEIVRQVASETFGVDEVSAETAFVELGVDSLWCCVSEIG
jgi:hypothetical protein